MTEQNVETNSAGKAARSSERGRRPSEEERAGASDRPRRWWPQRKVEVVLRLLRGESLSALTALLTGVYHLSRRNTVALLGDLMGVRISLGSVSNVEMRVATALEDAHAEALECVRRARVKHIDATSWAQSGTPRSLWTFASRLATAFRITLDATEKTVCSLAEQVRGTLVSDRGPQFGFWAMERRQICWAHLVGASRPSRNTPIPRCSDWVEHCCCSLRRTWLPGIESKTAARHARSLGRSSCGWNPSSLAISSKGRAWASRG